MTETSIMTKCYESPLKLIVLKRNKKSLINEDVARDINSPSVTMIVLIPIWAGQSRLKGLENKI